MNTQLPVVAIIGRPNVGKSSLFNRLLGERRAIVADEPGTTRDRVQGVVEWGGRNFWLIDTAGLIKAVTPLEQDVQGQTEEVIKGADLLLLVTDGTTIPTQEDHQIAKRALKAGLPLILAVNKLDSPDREPRPEFRQLGIKSIHGVSAIHGRGSGDLLDSITAQLPRRSAKPDGAPGLALLGRPNVGKSSLFNVLAEGKRAVTAASAGTTRDVNRQTIRFHKQPLELLDTAGIRRRGKIRPGIEKFSFYRTIDAIQAAEVCVVLIDATEPSTALDQKIAGMVKEAGKGLILALNKWDLIKNDESAINLARRRLTRDFQFAWWAPLVYTAATDGHNVAKLPELAFEIIARRQRRLPTAKLNEILAAASAHHPPAAFKGLRPRLKYITQTGTSPPEFTVFGSHADQLHWSYVRYLETNLREELELGGTPIRLRFRAKEPAA